MRVEFFVDWGYRHIYFTEKYLPKLCFDGRIDVQGGKLVDVKHLEFQEDRFGCHVLTPIAVPYGKVEWKSTVCNCYDGYAFTIEGDDNTIIEINTESASGKFAIKDLLDNKHLTFDLENPFLLAVMHVYMQKDEWYLAKQKQNEIRIKGESFLGTQNNFFGVNGVVVPCGKSSAATFTFCAERSNEKELEVEGAIRVIQSKDQNKNVSISGVADYEVFINGNSVYKNAKYSCDWDHQSQHFEETFFSVPVHLLNDGENKVEIVNHDNQIVILTQMVRLFIKERKHLQILSCPKWTKKGKVFSVRVFALNSAKVLITCSDNVVGCDPSGEYEIHENTFNVFTHGENEYFFKATKSGKGEITFTDLVSKKTSTAYLSEIWDGESEAVEPKTGIEIKIDQPETYQYYFRKMLDEQMGNYVVLRGYRTWCVPVDKIYDLAKDCKKHQVYTDVIMHGLVKSYLMQAVIDASGEYNFAVGGHERTGIVYYGNYFDNPSVTTMEQAEKLTVQQFKNDYNALKVGDAKVAMGECSSGARYAYKAGLDILRHETYCANHLTILPDARGNARAYGKRVWGAHVASQHNIQAELETAIGRYWIAMYLPWVFGANLVFEEDSLFQNNKYYRMVNDDYMTEEKQKVTIEFYKHIQTHARKGKPQVDFAFIQGRHEAPFTAITTCNANMKLLYKDEDRRIWGKNGSPEEEWGHRQPEKGMHLLEIVAPNVYLTPLNQNAYKTRKVFASNPYGEWDFLPIEASKDAYANYKILFMLGWNTMAKECEGVEETFKNDYERLKNYVEQGGVIVLSVPQLSSRVDRKLIHDFENANLYNDGDVSDLFGVKIGKPCEEFSGEIKSVNFPEKDYTKAQDLIRLPSKDEGEDGDCRLAEITLDGAEVCLIDARSSRPLFIRKKLGKGYAYLLCTYAYPGHEKLKFVCANVLKTMLDTYVQKDICVRDNENQVYWSDWKEGNGGKLYLINIDWTKQDNKKTVQVVKGDFSFECEVKERNLLELAYQNQSVVYANTQQVNVVASTEDENAYEIYGFGTHTLNVVCFKNASVLLDGKEIAKTSSGKTSITIELFGKSTLHVKTI